ncbi:MAG TPA: hypothetical protein VMI54_14135 [Polyangiaceae bacterium]|nr:hypothetical protein [Polyangiaceae bacterium]
MSSNRRLPVLLAAVLAALAVYAGVRRSHETGQTTSPASTNGAAPDEAQGDEPPVVAPAEPAANPPRPVPAPATPPSAMDEPSLMTLLRSANGNDPTLAVELAREGNRRFPESSDAPERTSILVHALAELGESSQARGEAEHMVNHYPDSRWVREVELFTGAHRHRNVVLDADGRLRFVDPPPS